MATNEPNKLDPEMLELFRAELDTHLPALCSGLLSLEKGHVDDAQVEAMMRAAHSIKGAARIVGFDRAVTVSHAMEDCFAAAKRKQLVLGSDGVDVLLNAVDVLQQVCTQDADATMDETVIQPLLQRLAAVKEGRPQAPDTGSGQQESPAAATPLQPLARSPSEVVLPPEIDDAAAAGLRLNLLQALSNAKDLRVRLECGRVRAISVLGMSVLVSVLREAARREPQLEVSFVDVPPELRLLWQAIGVESAISTSDQEASRAG